MAYTTIDDPTIYFNTKLYTGNGSTLNVTGLDFQPDFTWLKCRGISYHHRLYDVIRTPLNSLRSDTTNAESADGDGLSAFNSDGFTVTQGGNTEYNNSGVNYVSWNWLASNTTASNSNGSITSTVSANTTAGFSIVSFTGNATAGATIGHGLGVAPKWVIVKNRINAQNWFIYHEKIGATKVIYLDLTNAQQTLTQGWNDTAPTSSVVSLGTEAGTNQSGSNMIAYCFAEKKGYSKIGAYRGFSGNSFIYTGFKPAFLLVKSNSYSSGNWRIYDNKRSTSGFNVIDDSLRPNTTAAEIDETSVDFLSNGFKYRANVTDADSGGTDYIYYAVAESPFVNSNGIPNNAR
tara:strand:- start:31 stop:1071 length:1041 start_codon:yes stop_codon:yes gene_type:complete